MKNGTRLIRLLDTNVMKILTYVAMEQLRGKYLCQNRVSGEIFETPQMCYVLIAASLFQDYPVDARLKWIKEYYDAISLHDISLPTPVMAGVRTPQRQFSSCVLIETDDSLDSINATSSSIVKYVSQKAGIGIGGGSIRAIGSPIRKGDAYHTGIIPFYKMFQAATKVLQPRWCAWRRSNNILSYLAPRSRRNVGVKEQQRHRRKSCSSHGLRCTVQQANV